MSYQPSDRPESLQHLVVLARRISDDIDVLAVSPDRFLLDIIVFDVQHLSDALRTLPFDDWERR